MKRNGTIAKLLVDEFGKDSFYTISSTQGPLKVVFTNKPKQEQWLFFTPFDTWNKIKSKVSKLLHSDGICVVCLEKEESNSYMTTVDNVIRRFTTYVNICSTCCEFVCMTCFKAQNGTRCPVCRQCLLEYSHMLLNNKDDCYCSDENEH